jgi:hypothetical protein
VRTLPLVHARHSSYFPNGLASYLQKHNKFKIKDLIIVSILK